MNRPRELGRYIVDEGRKMRYVIVALLSLTVGVFAGVFLAELSRHRREVDVEARSQTLESELTKKEGALKQLQARLASADQAIADRDARMRELERTKKAAGSVPADLIAKSVRQTERIAELEAEIAELKTEGGNGTGVEEEVDASQLDRKKIPLARDENLRVVNGRFRGEHPIAEGQFTVTQVRLSGADTDFGDLLFEMRNDSGVKQDSIYFTVDILSSDGSLLENRTLQIGNWPPGALRSAATYIENPDGLYEVRISQ
jgi:hypothetical protein